jgi:hypothetical protein
MKSKCFFCNAITKDKYCPLNFNVTNPNYTKHISIDKSLNIGNMYLYNTMSIKKNIIFLNDLCDVSVYKRWTEYGPNSTNQKLVHNFIFNSVFYLKDIFMFGVSATKSIPTYVKIIIDNRVFLFNKIKVIGQGASAVIISIYDTEHMVELAIKIELHHDIVIEKQISDKLNISQYDIFLKIKFINTLFTNNYYFMNIKQGDCIKLKKKNKL